MSFRRTLVGRNTHVAELIAERFAVNAEAIGHIAEMAATVS
jgi:hypothetical protein